MAVDEGVTVTSAARLCKPESRQGKLFYCLRTGSPKENSEHPGTRMAMVTVLTRTKYSHGMYTRCLH